MSPGTFYQLLVFEDETCQDSMELNEHSTTLGEQVSQLT
jgi:hypothetical protein